MKIQKGFTLAEVLIAIGIVGILAAVTMPALMNNAGKQSIGTSLLKAMNTLDNANKLALTHEDTTKISAACKDYDDYLVCIKPHLNFTKTDLSSAKYHENFLGTDSAKTYKSGIGSVNAYSTKDNITFLMDNKDLSVQEDADDTYIGKYYTVYVDVNGVNKAPNSYGKDIFKFKIDDSGSVIPIGSGADKSYSGHDGSEPDWKKNCPNNKMPIADKGLDCTGSIVDNSGKIAYKY